MRPYDKKMKRGQSVRWCKANCVPRSVEIKGQSRNWTPMGSGRTARVYSLIIGYAKFVKATKGMPKELRNKIFWRLF